MKEMKFVIAAALIGAVAAFAPAQKGKVSTRLHASAVVAAQPPPGFWKIADLDVVEETNLNFQHNPGMALAADAIIDDLGSAVDRAFSPAHIFAQNVVSSLKTLKKRSRTCQIVRRRGRLYVIDKKNPRNKARQGGAKMKKHQK